MQVHQYIDRQTAAFESDLDLVTADSLHWSRSCWGSVVDYAAGKESASVEGEVGSEHARKKRKAHVKKKECSLGIIVHGLTSSCEDRESLKL